MRGVDQFKHNWYIDAFMYNIEGHSHHIRRVKGNSAVPPTSICTHVLFATDKTIISQAIPHNMA